MDFYRHSNTHNPDQDRFEDLYRRDFIHAISHVACCKLSCHHLDPYQRAAFHRGIIRYNMGEEEADPTLELAMEYAGALGTIVFDESCHLRDLTEGQIGRNQYTTDLELERLDGEADHAAERIGALEDKEADMERSLNALLELGQEQTEASTRAAHGLGQLAALSHTTIACTYNTSLSPYNIHSQWPHHVHREKKLSENRSTVRTYPDHPHITISRQ